jgi:hypothetical protein
VIDFLLPHPPSPHPPPPLATHLLTPFFRPSTTTYDRPCALAFSIISAARSPESILISDDDLPVDPELSVLSMPASSAAEAPPSSLKPYSASSPPSPAPGQYKARLWRHFPGWV